MGPDLVGGQAIAEGVMMRQGPRWSAAVRAEDGSIATTVQIAEPALGALRGVPVVRGVGALVDSVRIGMMAMRWSRTQSGPPDSPDSPERPAQEQLIVAAVVAVVLAAFLLFPLALAAAVRPLVGAGWGAAVVEGAARLGLFVGYLALLARLPGLRRTLEYHGAEHMVIAAHEHGEARLVSSARLHSVRHPRCGTDFFTLIFAVSIVAFALVGELPSAELIVSRIVLAPVIVGLSYEILRAGGTASNDRFAHALAAPGLFMQRFTTRDPSDAQIDVALAALDALVPASLATATVAA